MYNSYFLYVLNNQLNIINFILIMSISNKYYLSIYSHLKKMFTLFLLKNKMEEYNMEKRERVRNIIFPIILRLLGRISSGGKGKETEISGLKIKLRKEVRLGKNIKLQGTLYTPVCLYVCMSVILF